MGWAWSKRSIFCVFLLKTQKNIGSIQEISEKHLTNGLFVYIEADEGTLVLFERGFWNVSKIYE